MPRSPALTVPEQPYQAAIIRAARLTGWLVYHTHDSRRSEPGFPDLIMVRGTRMIAAEVKSVSGRVSQAQQAWLDAIGAVDAVSAHVWRPDDWDQIVDMLRPGGE